MGNSTSGDKDKGVFNSLSLFSLFTADVDVKETIFIYLYIFMYRHIYVSICGYVCTHIDMDTCMHKTHPK